MNASREGLPKVNPPAGLRIVGALVGLLVGCTDSRLAQQTGRDPQLIAGQSRVEEVNLLAMGDWGNGSDRQRRTARALAHYVRSSGETFDVRFDAPGRYRYYCEPHRALGMMGEVVVQ